MEETVSKLLSHDDEKLFPTIENLVSFRVFFEIDIPAAH